MGVNFLLGVGAQRAGTSWTYNYVSENPQFQPGFFKEYHVFDSIYLPPALSYLDQYREDALQQEQRLELGLPTDSFAIDRLKFIQSPNLYFEHFSNLIRNGQGKNLTGETTPLYAALSAAAFSSIRENLLKASFTPKVVFMMRDPVARAISAARLMLRQDPSLDQGKGEVDFIRSVYPSIQFDLRARYDITIKNLEAVFKPEEIHFGFFENLFTEKSIRALCSFLELDYRVPNFSAKVNTTQSSTTVPSQLRQEITLHNLPVYEYVINKFGNDLVEKAWG